MKLSIFKKISGILFLVSAFFVVISMVLAFNEYGASVLDDTLIFNTLCVILLVAAGVLSLLLRFEVPLFAVVGSYFVLNIIASIFYAFHWSWWSEGIFKTLGRMSTFILPTSAFVWPVTATSILLDLANLASITGSILLFISIASTRTTSHVIPTTSPSKTLSFENTMRTRSTSVMNAPSDTPNSMNSNELASPAVRLGSYLLESFFTLITLGIGWLVWSFVIWGQGTTPGHQVLKLYIVSEKTGKTFSWVQMFVREFLVKGLLLPLLSVFTLGILFLVDSFMVVRDDRKTLHDRICGSIVVQR